MRYDVNILKAILEFERTKLEFQETATILIDCSDVSVYIERIRNSERDTHNECVHIRTLGAGLSTYRRMETGYVLLDIEIEDPATLDIRMDDSEININLDEIEAIWVNHYSDIGAEIFNASYTIQ